MKVFAVFVLVMQLSSAGAATLYNWKDDAGQMHFTDNPANVPSQYRAEAAKEVRGFSIAGEGIEPSQGGLLWQNHCISCHFVGYGKNSTGAIGVSGALMDKGKKKMLNLSLIVLTVQDVVKRTHTGYIKKKLGMSDVSLIGRYLAEEQVKVPSTQG